MIQSVTVTNDLGESIVLGIGAPDKSGLLISEIDGIDPDRANINLIDMSTIDGSVYSSARFPSRTITISMYYVEQHDYDTIEDLRHLSYKYFPLKQKVNLMFETDNRFLYIDGYVEGNSTNIFSDQEETQVSIVCPNPYFTRQTEVFNVSGTFLSMFEFPFSNESLDEPLLEFGEYPIQEKRAFYYYGEVDTGCIIKLKANGIVGNVEIENEATGEIVYLNSSRIASLLNMGYSESAAILENIQGDTGANITGIDSITSVQENVVEGSLMPGIRKGDKIYISTIPGNKYAILIRDNIEYDIIGAIDRETDWIHIVRGYNLFDYKASRNREYLELELEYPILYAGV